MVDFPPIEVSGQIRPQHPFTTSTGAMVSHRNSTFGEYGCHNIFYFNCDQIGTPRELVNQSGEVIQTMRTAAWGRTLPSLPGYETPVIEPRIESGLRFQGQYEDPETGLHYNRHRYYDPDAGIFLSPDPLGLYGGINSYRYARNPTQWIDPTGLKSKCKSSPTCDPCAGKNPAAWASQWQGRKAYPGKDVWTNMALEKDTVIYGGMPGQTGFYFSESTLLDAQGSKDRLGRSLQIRPHETFGYRPRVQAYRLKKDTCVAVSIASAQDATKFGPGGGVQFYLSNFRSAIAKEGQPIPMK